MNIDHKVNVFYYMTPQYAVNSSGAFSNTQQNQNGYLFCNYFPS
jgi:hypothetical protein